MFNEPQVLKNASSPSEFRDEMSGIAYRLATFIKPFIWPSACRSPDLLVTEAAGGSGYFQTWSCCQLTNNSAVAPDLKQKWALKCCKDMLLLLLYSLNGCDQNDKIVSQNTICFKILTPEETMISNRFLRSLFKKNFFWNWT